MFLRQQNTTDGISLLTPQLNSILRCSNPVMAVDAFVNVVQGVDMAVVVEMVVVVAVDVHFRREI